MPAHQDKARSGTINPFPSLLQNGPGTVEVPIITIRGLIKCSDSLLDDDFLACVNVNARNLGPVMQYETVDSVPLLIHSVQVADNRSNASNEGLIGQPERVDVVPWREACRILNEPNQSAHLTIEAIAANLGFNSRSNFTVTFKRITGISPSDFMKMAKEK